MITKEQIMESAHQLRELGKLGPNEPGILGAYLNTLEDEDFSSLIPDTSLRSILILLINAHAHYWRSI